MKTEVLKVTSKIIRKKSYGRNKETYCVYTAENKNRKHKLKTKEGTKLFDLLENNVVISNHNNKKGSVDCEIIMDGLYHNNELVCVRNFRKTLW